MFVPVPDDAHSFSMGFTILWWETDKTGVGIKHLPPTHEIYLFVCTTDTITDDQAVELFGFKAITKDGKLYKYGITAPDGLPACSSDKTGWTWDKFALTISAANDILLAEHGITGRHAIIEML